MRIALVSLFILTVTVANAQGNPDHEIDIVTGKITTLIKAQRYGEALPYFRELESKGGKLPESFDYYYVDTLARAGESTKAIERAKAYLKKHGSKGKHYPQVIELVGRLELEADAAEKELWRKASDAKDSVPLQAYLDRFPTGRHAAEARTALATLMAEAALRAEADLWRKAEHSSDSSTVQGYLARYPNGRYAASARSKLAVLKEEEAQRIEAAAWRRAEQAKDSATVQSFLDRYPASRHAVDAKLKLAAIAKEEADAAAIARLGKVFRDCPECPEMVVIPAGSFEMGGRLLGQHRVVIGKPFALAKTEVTQRQWRDLMGSNPSHYADCGDDCPVDQVTWNDAQEYMRKLSQKTGKTYRLPSEAEWEYACRAGGRHTYCGSDDIDSVAWYSSGFWINQTHPVAGKQPNALGLYDMTGNLLEWTEDCFNQGYAGAPTDGSAWTSGNCAYRIARGGFWNTVPQQSTAEFRHLGEPALASRVVSYIPSHAYGFRPARVLP